MHQENPSEKFFLHHFCRVSGLGCFAVYQYRPWCLLSLLGEPTGMIRYQSCMFSSPFILYIIARLLIKNFRDCDVVQVNEAEKRLNKWLLEPSSEGPSESLTDV